MILIIIGCLSAGAVIGFVTAALLQAGADHREEPTHRDPTKLLTVGSTVGYHGRVWEIRRFLVDNGEIILRRTMAPVEELEEATE